MTVTELGKLHSDHITTCQWRSYHQRARQDHLAGVEAQAEFGQLIDQPGHGRRGVAERRGPHPSPEVSPQVIVMNVVLRGKVG